VVGGAICALIDARTDHRSGGIAAGPDVAARQRDLAEALRGALASKRKSEAA
jgi:hypothetical protein